VETDRLLPTTNPSAMVKVTGTDRVPSWTATLPATTLANGVPSTPSRTVLRPLTLRLPPTVVGVVAFPKLTVLVPLEVAVTWTFPPKRSPPAPVLLRLTLSLPRPVWMVVFPWAAPPVPVMVTVSLPFPMLKYSDPV